MGHAFPYVFVWQTKFLYILWGKRSSTPPPHRKKLLICNPYLQGFACFSYVLEEIIYAVLDSLYFAIGVILWTACASCYFYVTPGKDRLKLFCTVSWTNAIKKTILTTCPRFVDPTCNWCSSHICSYFKFFFYRAIFCCDYCRYRPIYLMFFPPSVLIRFPQADYFRMFINPYL